MTACLFVMTGCLPAAMTYPSGGFPLRNSFGGGAQLSPTYEPTAAVSCITIASNRHLCRHIYGYEEGGAHFTYYLSDPGVMSYAKGGKFGWALVTDAGGRYEGCAYVGRTDRYAQTWICDYRANWHTYYTGSYSYLKVFKDWASIVGDQASCAGSFLGWWRGGLSGATAWASLVRDCGTYPYDPSHRRITTTSTEAQPIDAGGSTTHPEAGVTIVPDGDQDGGQR